VGISLTGLYNLRAANFDYQADAPLIWLVL
jgi:hypothetical protein